MNFNFDTVDSILQFSTKVPGDNNKPRDCFITPVRFSCRHTSKCNIDKATRKLLRAEIIRSHTIKAFDLSEDVGWKRQDDVSKICQALSPSCPAHTIRTICHLCLTGQADLKFVTRQYFPRHFFFSTPAIFFSHRPERALPCSLRPILASDARSNRVIVGKKIGEGWDERLRSTIEIKFACFQATHVPFEATR